MAISTIKFFAPVNYETGKRLMDAVDNLVKSGQKEICLLISTPGGEVFTGISIYNYLKGLPIKLTTCNFGSVDSIGVVIFCAGTNRYSSPQARFLMHPISTNISGPLQLGEPQLIEIMKSMKADEKNIARIISSNTNKKEKDVIKEMDQRTVLMPEEAKEWGLIQEIKEKLLDDNQAEIISINI